MRVDESRPPADRSAPAAPAVALHAPEPGPADEPTAAADAAGAQAGAAADPATVEAAVPDPAINDPATEPTATAPAPAAVELAVGGAERAAEAAGARPVAGPAEPGVDTATGRQSGDADGHAGSETDHPAPAPAPAPTDAAEGEPVPVPSEAAAAAGPETGVVLPPAASVVPIVPPRRSREPEQPALVGMTLPELEAFMAELGQPAYRARQVFEWIFRELAPDFASMTSLPKALRTRLTERATVTAGQPIAEAVSSDGQTTKVLMGLHDGNTVETVLMDYDPVDGRTRHTVCVSSQAGCAVACPFCATGQSGFVRNLTAAEIVDQVLYFARRRRREHPGEAPITNIVFMGQGEPFANFDRVWKAVEVLNSPYGFSLGARHMTISTSGVVPRILELAEKPLQVNLAISLHAPNDELRDVLVPLNKRWPLAELMAACREYIARTNRRVTFEYVLLRGINDRPEHARDLADLLEGMLAHVNLIPMNPTDDPTYQAPTRQDVVAFQRELLRRGILATVRVERGVDIDAACGQLRVRVAREEGWASAAEQARARFGDRIVPAPAEERVADSDEETRARPVSPGPRVLKPRPGGRTIVLPRRLGARGAARPEAEEFEEFGDDEPEAADPGVVPGNRPARRPDPGRRPGAARPAAGRDAGRPWRAESERPWRARPEPLPGREADRPWRAAGETERGGGRPTRPAGPRGTDRPERPRFEAERARPGDGRGGRGERAGYSEEWRPAERGGRGFGGRPGGPERGESERRGMGGRGFSGRTGGERAPGGASRFGGPFTPAGRGGPGAGAGGRGKARPPFVLRNPTLRGAHAPRTRDEAEAEARGERFRPPTGGFGGRGGRPASTPNRFGGASGAGRLGGTRPGRPGGPRPGGRGGPGSFEERGPARGGRPGGPGGPRGGPTSGGHGGRPGGGGGRGRPGGPGGRRGPGSGGRPR